MAEDNAAPDKAAAAQGAGKEDLDEKTQGNGNPAPVAPSNKPEDDDDKTKNEDGKPGSNGDDGEDEDNEDNASSEDDDNGEEDTPLDTELWGSTGDEVGDSVLALLQNSGLSPDEAKAIMFDAVKAGDVSKVDRDALVEKVGKSKATLILAGAENFVSRSKNKAESILNDVHKTVGGEDNWALVKDWAQKNVSGSELDEYRTLIDAGGAKARFAAQELAARYNSDDANSTLDAETQEIIGDAKATPKTKMLTKKEYVAQIEEAYDNNASEKTIKAIKAARQRGRAAGI